MFRRPVPKRRGLWIGAGLTALLVAVPLVIAGSEVLVRNRVETPDYEVIARHEGFEVRRYAPRLVAEVDVADPDPRDATNAGFRTLADFIFGNNAETTEVAMTTPVQVRASSTKIAMTTPVDLAASGEGRWTVAFTMPSKWTMKTLPRPIDDRVRIRQLPERTYAVQRFSGAPAHEVVRARMDALVESVRAAGLTPAATEPVYARYDPPWTPGFVRRNEVLVELRDFDLV